MKSCERAVGHAPTNILDIPSKYDETPLWYSIDEYGVCTVAEAKALVRQRYEFTSVDIQQPIIGQRVLVYDPVYKDWTIAYWTRDSQFEEWQQGQQRTVPGMFWAPLPRLPGQDEMAGQVSDIATEAKMKNP